MAYLFRLLKQQQQQPTNQQTTTTTTTTTTKQKRTVTDSIMNIVCLLHPPYSHYLIIRYKGKQGPKTSFSHVSTRTCVLLRFLLIVKPNTLEDGYRIPKNYPSLVFKKKKKTFLFQQQIIAAVKQVCNHFPTLLKPQCEAFISEYGPQVIELLLQKLSPQIVCAAIRLCASHEQQLQSELCMLVLWCVHTSEIAILVNCACHNICP